MRIQRGLLGWGVFLALVGAVPLLVRGGYLSDDQVRGVGSLWPLIVIGIGIAILLGRTRFAALGGILIAATFGIIVGGFLSGGIGGFGLAACGAGQGSTAFPAQTAALAETTARITIKENCGETAIGAAPGMSWRVEGEDRDGTGPQIDAGPGSLGIRSRDDDRGPFAQAGQGARWRITLPTDVRLDLDLDLNAGSLRIDLAGASLDRVDLRLNAGSTVLDLGSAKSLEELTVAVNAGSLDLRVPNQSLTGSIDVNAGSVNLCVPPGAGLRLNTTESVVATYDYEDHGLVKTGNSWETPGFASAGVQIELDTRASLGSFSLDPEGGCDG